MGSSWLFEEQDFFPYFRIDKGSEWTSVQVRFQMGLVSLPVAMLLLFLLAYH